MSDYRLHQADELDMDTVLSEDFFFEGQIVFEKPLMIKGRFKGDIKSRGDLYINQGAEVEARIEAGRVWLRGSVTGEIRTSEKLELFSGSSLEGDISTPDLIIQSGCRFQGHCEMPRRAIKKEEPSK